MLTFYSHGKLLITAEYLVLDGANALAVPTKLGQSLTVENIKEPIINWTSFDHQNELWFHDSLIFKDNKTVSTKKPELDKVSKRLVQILNAAFEMNPGLTTKDSGYAFKTSLDFPRDWGLGTSSTLITNISKWAKINPYILLAKTFGGSGYDIACAQSNSPITYKLLENQPIVEKANFNPTFKNHLYFLYLNKKQDSRKGIAYYKANRTNYTKAIAEVNDITNNIINCKSLTEFARLINEHEAIISKVSNQQPVKELFFKDFNGSIKSLGAWGGDFILVASEINPKAYFQAKGFDTLLNYSEFIL